MENKTTADLLVVEVEGVHGYVDENGMVHVLVDDVARGLGIVMVRKERVTTSGDNSPADGDTVTTSGDKFLAVLTSGDKHSLSSDDDDDNGIYYTAVRWERLNKYLRALGCLGKDDPDVKSGDYISEVWVYLLAMKANNETALKFQWKVAGKILPSIRKYGYYSLVPEDKLVVTTKTADKGSEKVRVYVLRLSDNTVHIAKIGQSKNIRSRVAKIKRETGLTVVDIYFTPEMLRKDARLVEWASQEKFSPQRIKGEYFSAKFSKVCATVKYYVELVSVAPIEHNNLIA